MRPSWIAIMAAATVLDGCYLAHERPPGDAGVLADAHPPDAPSSCLPPPECGPGPTPILHYAFEHDLASSSTSTLAGMSHGVVRYVPGPVGLALEMRPGVSVSFPGTEVLLARASALTFSVWVHTNFPPTGTTRTAGRTFLGCRTFDRGFEAFGYQYAVTTCAGDGFGAPRGWGGCATTGGCDGDWAQFVLRWRGVGTEPEIAVSGSPWSTIVASPDPEQEAALLAGLELFTGGTALVSGVGAGDGEGAGDGTIAIDDLRVYDVALEDPWNVTRCPAP